LINEQADEDIPVQILISVSKRIFKKAVDRNQVKRYIREAYRIQKSILWDKIDSGQLQFGVMYIDKEVRDFAFHQKAIERLLRKLSKEVSNK
jgi:ribonuclease P protein component